MQGARRVGAAVGRTRLLRVRERGSSMVELSIAMSFLLLMVFGIIQFGIAYNDFLNVRQGTREAARLGVVNDLDNAPPCKINGTTVTPPASPVTEADATNALICKTKDRIGLDGDDTKVRIEITGEAIGENLKVCARFPLSAIAGITEPFVSGTTLESSVTMRLEQVPEFAEYAETGMTC